MAEITTGLPEGTYDLKIGQSFSKSSKNRPEYHTLRYDFKPKSVSAEPETYISISSNDDVQVCDLTKSLVYAFLADCFC